MLRTVDSAELRREISRLLDENLDGALLFDADGTLWSHDVGHSVFEHACRAGLLREPARAALAFELQGAGAEVDPQKNASELGLLLLDACRVGSYSEKAAAEMQVWAYAGFEETELRALTQEALLAAGHDAGLHQHVLALAGWARERGAVTYVVSASPLLVVEEATRALGFSAEFIAGGVAHRVGAHFEPSLAAPLPYGPGKVDAGRALSGERPWLAAFGDSGFDLEMLALARVAVGIGEKSALIAGLERFPNALRLSPP